MAVIDGQKLLHKFLESHAMNVFPYIAICKPLQYYNKCEHYKNQLKDYLFVVNEVFGDLFIVIILSTLTKLYETLDKDVDDDANLKVSYNCCGNMYTYLRKYITVHMYKITSMVNN